MRRLSPVILLLAVAHGSPVASELRWPDPGIPVPPLVREFIVAECVQFQGHGDEDLSGCIRGEAYGYRAVHAMLTDADEGEHAARRYRACRAGLGAHGGRFHRRRAECIGASLGYKWRFEFSQRASLGEDRQLAGIENRDPGPASNAAGVALAGMKLPRQDSGHPDRPDTPGD